MHAQAQYVVRVLRIELLRQSTAVATRHDNRHTGSGKHNVTVLTVTDVVPRILRIDSNVHTGSIHAECLLQSRNVEC